MSAPTLQSDLFRVEQFVHRFSMATKQDLVDKYAMQPHPEGGFYVETFRSTSTVQTELGPRSSSTAIYFLMCHGSISRLHRITSDEVWHFYLGKPITVVELVDATGGFKTTTLGPNINSGEVVQYVVKRNTWFGSYPNLDENDSIEDQFSFVGCTVSPGFEFSDFELASNAKLTADYPLAASSGVIGKMTVGLP